MSTMTMTFFSKALIGCQQVVVYLPIGAEYEELNQPGEKFQTLWLLHGHGGNYSEWARYTCIEKLAMDHKFAVVMPDGGHSGYCDQPDNMNYYTWITKELPETLRKYFPLSDKREDNFIAGLSMGGIGAAKLGFANPDLYSAIGILSAGPGNPAVKSSRMSDDKIEYNKRFHTGYDPIEGTYNDIWENFKKLPQSGYDMPLIYDACGTKDFLYGDFCSFREYVHSLGLDDKVIFEEGEGGVHSWDFWDEYIAKFVDVLPLKNRGFWRKWYDTQFPATGK